MTQRLPIAGAASARSGGKRPRIALADYDRARLIERLAAASRRRLPTCDRTVSKTFRLAFRQGVRAWDRATLSAAGVGAWAQESLLALSPRPCLEVAERVRSDDGTTRLLLRATDGALIESVIIPAHAGRDRPRTTLCISSQVGCARACSFCETGVSGLERQLGAGEIVDQYRLALELCGDDTLRPTDRRAAPPANVPDTRGGRRGRLPISNIVFMGMGEPMDNLDEVVSAVSLLTDPHAFAFAPSRVTVSTVGVAHRFEEFFARTRAELAISINAPDDRRRAAIMPVSRRFDLARLREELRAALPPNRRVLFQYALFAGFNDSLADADALAAYVAPFRCRVNVIPANPGPDPTLRTPPPERVDAFVARLAERGVTTLVRQARGRDVGGACGQLAGSRRQALGVPDRACGVEPEGP